MSREHTDVKILTNHDDWEALYVNGEFRTEGHRITIQDVINELGVDAENLYVGAGRVSWRFPWCMDARRAVS